MVSEYKTLRTWSLVLMALGVISLVCATIGVISWAIEVDGIGSTLAVLLFGAPIALLLATWPIALAQMMRALANVGDALSLSTTLDPSRL